MGDVAYSGSPVEGASKKCSSWAGGSVESMAYSGAAESSPVVVVGRRRSSFSGGKYSIVVVVGPSTL